MRSNYKIFAILVISIMVAMPIATGYAASYTAVYSSNDNTAGAAFFTAGFYVEGEDESTLATDGSIKYREIVDNGITKKMIHGTYKLSSDDLELRMIRSVSCPEMSYSISATADPQVISGSTHYTLPNAVVSIELENGYIWNSSDGLWKLNGSGGVANLPVSVESLGAAIYLTIPYTSPAVIGKYNSIAVDLRIDIVGIDESLNGVYTEETTIGLNLIPNLVPDMASANSNLKKYTVGDVPHYSNWSLNRPVDYGDHPAVNIKNNDNSSGGISKPNGRTDSLTFKVVDDAFLIVFTSKVGDQPNSCSIPITVKWGTTTYSGNVSYGGGTTFVGLSNGSITAYSTIPIDDDAWFSPPYGVIPQVTIPKNVNTGVQLALDIIFDV